MTENKKQDISLRKKAWTGLSVCEATLTYVNIARGTTDPGYWLRNLSYLFEQIIQLSNIDYQIRVLKYIWLIWKRMISIMSEVFLTTFRQYFWEVLLCRRASPFYFYTAVASPVVLFICCLTKLYLDCITTHHPEVKLLDGKLQTS